MKVELGNCTACGEKNSKWVQNCHKCHALLPWTAGYQAPTSEAEPELKPETPLPVSTAAPTVEISPQDFKDSSAPVEATPTPQLPLAPSEPTAPRKAPPYAGWAVAGVLGIACVALWVRGNRAPDVLPAAPLSTPIATPLPTANGAQNLPTFPTSIPETNALPAVTPTVAPPIAVARRGPSFAEVEENLTDAAQKFTDAQKQDYWNRVVGSRVSWRGQVVNVSASGEGEIVLKCNPHSDSTVTLALDGSQMARLPSINKNQMLSIEGILQEHGDNNYKLSRGRIMA